MSYSDKTQLRNWYQILVRVNFNLQLRIIGVDMEEFRGFMALPNHLLGNSMRRETKKKS